MAADTEKTLEKAECEEQKMNKSHTGFVFINLCGIYFLYEVKLYVCLIFCHTFTSCNRERLAVEYEYRNDAAYYHTEHNENGKRCV